MTAAADLTADQSAAAESFAGWLKQSPDGTPFVLSGFAGSGKTFLSMHLLRQVEQLGLCWTVVAPTHKAVGVLRQALDLEGLQPTWYPSTIHRLLRLKLKRSADSELCEPTELHLKLHPPDPATHMAHSGCTVWQFFAVRSRCGRQHGVGTRRVLY